MAMIPRVIILITAAASVAFAAVPAQATSNHTYAKNEYAIIYGGLAPTRRVSLSAHGEGELGDGNFRVWLMAEPAHRKIMALPDITPDNNLDTAPDAYHAVWSKDSRHVGVSFRTDRHDVTLNLYAVEGSRVQPIGGPTLFKEVTSRDVTDDDDLRDSLSSVDWRGGDRFVLTEFRAFIAKDPAFLRLLGDYGRVTEKLDDGRLFVQFGAEADCVLLPDHHYRVIDRKPADPKHQPDW